MKKPNWKKKDDYEYTKGFQGPEWAWEFLRRNPDYKKEYAAIKSGKMDDWVYEPEKSPGESNKQWSKRCINVLHVQPQRPSRANVNWMLKSGYHNPTLNAHELENKGTPVSFDVDAKVEVFKLWEDLDDFPVTVDETSQITLIRSDRLLVALDLTRPKKPQLDQIQKHFSDAKSDLKAELSESRKNSPKPKASIFRNAIRALDARGSGVNKKHDIGVGLFGKRHTNINVAVGNCIDTADHNVTEGYKAIARRRTKIPE